MYVSCSCEADVAKTASQGLGAHTEYIFGLWFMCFAICVCELRLCGDFVHVVHTQFSEKEPTRYMLYVDSTLTSERHRSTCYFLLGRLRMGDSNFFDLARLDTQTCLKNKKQKNEEKKN